MIEPFSLQATAFLRLAPAIGTQKIIAWTPPEIILPIKRSRLMSANLPTPLIGVWERISIGAFMVWMVVLALLLLKAENKGHN